MKYEDKTPHEWLAVAADFLETVPAEQFDLHNWQTKRGAKAFTGQFDCGFAGCAIGWIAHAGVVPGLKLDEDKSPDFRHSLGWYAVYEAFSLEPYMAYHFFDEASYDQPATPNDVAKRIKDWLA